MGRKSRKNREQAQDNALVTVQPKDSWGKCTHDQLNMVFKVGKCEVWAGSATQVWRALCKQDIDILVSVGGASLMRTATDPIIEMVGLANEALPQTKAWGKLHKPDGTITIDWHDYQAPPVGFGFFEDLVSDIQDFDGSIAIFCMGGHGRTGTALAAIAHAAQIVPEGEDVVEWVRKAHCQKSVESAAQLDWLRENGVPTKCEESKSRFGSFGNFDKTRGWGNSVTPAAGSAQDPTLPIYDDMSGEMGGMSAANPGLPIAPMGGLDCDMCKINKASYIDDLDSNLCSSCAMTFGMHGAKVSKVTTDDMWDAYGYGM